MPYEDYLALASQPVTPDFNPGDAYADNMRLFQGIPSIEVTRLGRLWATWYSGGQGESPLNYVMLATSSDQGDSWSKPVLVIDPPGKVRACDPNIWIDPLGKLWLFWMQTHTLHDGRWGVWAMCTSDPENEKSTWTKPRRLSDGIMLNKPTVLTTGRWLFPISKLSSHPMHNEKRMLPGFLRDHIVTQLSEKQLAAIDDNEGAYVYASDDHGETFTCLGKAQAERATHNEHMIVERKDGSLWMLLRTPTGQAPAVKDVISQVIGAPETAHNGIGQSLSTDGGVTWSPVTNTNLPHTSTRFFLTRLASGKLMLVKHGPMQTTDDKGKPVEFVRSDLTAYLSTDDGNSWQGGLILSPVGSYPDGTQASDGRIYVTSDFGRRKEKEIVLARFGEEDILAGDFISPNAKGMILINQATGVIDAKDDWSQYKGKDDDYEPLIFTGI